MRNQVEKSIPAIKFTAYIDIECSLPLADSRLEDKAEVIIAFLDTLAFESR